MRTIGEASCGKTVDCGLEFTSRRDLPARFPGGPAVRRNKQLPSQSLAPDREAATSARQKYHPVGAPPIGVLRKESPTRLILCGIKHCQFYHDSRQHVECTESCRNRFSGLNRRYNAGQNDGHPYSRCLGKAEFGTHRKPPGSRPQPGRVATRHLFPAFAKGPSQDCRSFAEVKQAARGHPLRCGGSWRNVAIISSPKRPRSTAG